MKLGIREITKTDEALGLVEGDMVLINAEPTDNGKVEVLMFVPFGAAPQLLLDPSELDKPTPEQFLDYIHSDPDEDEDSSEPSPLVIDDPEAPQDA